MGFEYVSKLPTPDEIRAQFPLAPELAAEKARKDAAIRDVFTGDSDKFLVIIVRALLTGKMRLLIM